MTTNDATPRDAFQKVISGELVEYAAEVSRYEDDDYQSLDRIARSELRRGVADSVIAHIWQAASDPEVLEAVARFGIDGWDDYTPDGPLQEGARNMAKGEIAELLTLLIGPPPNNN